MKLKYVIIGLLFVALFVLILNCDKKIIILDKGINSFHMSKTIEESIDMGLFLAEYDVIGGDSSKYLFRTAFAEKKYYPKSDKYDNQAYLIYLPIKYGYDDYLSIVQKKGDYMESSGFMIKEKEEWSYVFNVTESNVKDTILLKLEYNNIVDTITLIRKK